MTVDWHDQGGPVGRGILSRPDGATIAYRRLEGKNPGVVFLHGYRSDMSGTKALAIEALCRATGHSFVRFDQFGHGESSGEMASATIGRWVDDSVAVLDSLTHGPQILVGSSLGGWLATLTALERPQRVAALVGVAAALDFTEDLIWASLSAQARRDLLIAGEVPLPGTGDPAWRIPRALIEEGRNHLLLRDRIGLDCPVRLLHGQRDAEVPWQTSVRFADALASDDVQILLVKDGDHRLSRPADLDRLTQVVGGLLGA